MVQRNQAALVAWLVFAVAQASLCSGQAIVEPAVVSQGAQQDVAFAFFHLATDFPKGCAPAACRFTRAQPRALAVVPAILEAQNGLIAARCQLPAFMVSTAGHVSARLLCAEQATGQPAAIDVLPHHSGLSLLPTDVSPPDAGVPPPPPLPLPTQFESPPPLATTATPSSPPSNDTMSLTPLQGASAGVVRPEWLSNCHEELVVR
ncbi:hypothetical protein V8C86DRAFT_3022831 [Haematococcus lacustris]